MINQTYPVAYKASSYVELPDITDGLEAFRRGEYPQPNWTPAKCDGWSMAGRMATLREGQATGAAACDFDDVVGA